MKLKTDGAIFHDEMARDIDGFYPWQYKDYMVKDITLIPIEADIKYYWDEPSIFRKGYKVDHENKIISIPHFLLKINGKHKNDKDYIDFIKRITSSKNTIVYYNNIPYSRHDFNLRVKDKSIKLLDYIKELDLFNKDNDKDLFYDYLEYLINDKNIVDKSCLNSMIREKQIQLINILFNHIENDIDNITLEDFEKLFFSLINIPDEIVILINNFDYGSNIPKVVFENCNFVERHGFLIFLLSKMGFDIIVFETSGAATIEKYLPIDSISLGYFEKDYDIKNKSMTKKEKIIDFIKNINTYNLFPKLYYGYMICSFISAVVFLFIYGIAFNITYQVIVTLILLLLTYLLHKNDYIDCNNDASGILTCFYGIAAVMCIFGLLICTGIDTETITYSSNTITYTGTLDLSDNILDTKKNYVMYSKKDSIVLSNSRKLYLYIENNENNENPMYFKIREGDSILYESTRVEPYEYVKYVELDWAFKRSNKDNNVVIEYYKYDDINNKKLSEMIGSQEMIIHIAFSNNELEELLIKYDLK